MFECLPKDLLSYIWKNYVSMDVKIFINKDYYIKYHYLVKYYYFKHKPSYKRYLRNIIRNDYSFIFQQILQENIKIWNIKKKEKIQYKKIIYYNLYDYLNALCIDNNASQCRYFLRNV